MTQRLMVHINDEKYLGLKEHVIHVLYSAKDTDAYLPLTGALHGLPGVFCVCAVHTALGQLEPTQVGPRDIVEHYTQLIERFEVTIPSQTHMALDQLFAFIEELVETDYLPIDLDVLHEYGKECLRDIPTAQLGMWHVEFNKLCEAIVATPLLEMPEHTYH